TTIRGTTATSTRTTTPKPRPERARGGRMLVALIVWSLFAFGGAYTWTIIPIVAGAVALAALVRPPVVASETRGLDVAIGLCLLIPCLQLVPLPPSVRLALSPALARIDRALYFNVPEDPARGPTAPLTVDAAATIEAFAVAAAVVLIFWSARSLF